MDERQHTTSDPFTQNRTEEIGHDVWEHFVVPPFYDRLDLQTARKPRVIVGGRGCGKTMLLRYLSHQSQFSSSRKTIDDSALQHIGIYWRADTQFAHAMTQRGIEDDTWRHAFTHWVALTLSEEVLTSLKTIETSAPHLLDHIEIDQLELSSVTDFDPDLPGRFSDLRRDLTRRLSRFQTWVNNARHHNPPLLLPAKHFLEALINNIKTSIPGMANATYFVYIDEYENLVEDQQRVINTWLKHSETPLIFNLAMKRNGFMTRQTVGRESITEVADFREHDIEHYLLEEFDLFAAEILFLRLSQKIDVPIGVDALRDPAQLDARRTDAYSEDVRTHAGQLLPHLTYRELANGVFADQGLTNALRKWVTRALKVKNSIASPDDFVRPDLPQASIVTPALLYRRGVQPEEVLAELHKAENGGDSRFTNTTNWIHNNFVGCLLRLYEPHSRTCPIYAGFDRFCRLSRGNIRHFLELCHVSLSNANRLQHTFGAPVPAQTQAEAARQVSAEFLGEIKSFGRHGNQLYTFVLWLGSIFAVSHQRPSQSEPEQSHFSVVDKDGTRLAESEVEFLREAVKWSVLFDERETKQKDMLQPENTQYVLNPIYAPYFHITFRKRRRLELRTTQLRVLIGGSYSEARQLLQSLSEQWSVDLTDSNRSLFSHLQENE